MPSLIAEHGVSPWPSYVRRECSKRVQRGRIRPISRRAPRRFVWRSKSEAAVPHACYRLVCAQQGGSRRIWYLPPRHGGLMLRFARLLWQEVVHYADRVCRDVTVCPGPLHNCMHPLPGAACSFRFVNQIGRRTSAQSPGLIASSLRVPNFGNT